MIPQEYDPTNIAPYLGKEFTTNGSKYRIDDDGKFRGRESLEGARVIGIASLAQRDKFLLSPLLDSRKSSTLLDALKEHGLAPTVGMSLVVVISQEDVEQRGRVGIMTSAICSIN